ncbi:MAG: ribosome biogenesis GTPase Der, partial [Firmicutes bacterium]|nr:ribosome biogenesis GTPase Der [Bacillota bacterium]
LRIKTSRLNQLLADAMAVVPPPTKKGRQLKIYYLTQTKVKPPAFAFFVNEPELAQFSNLRYLENKMRETYDFEGTPIRIVARKRGKKEER